MERKEIQIGGSEIQIFSFRRSRLFKGLGGKNKKPVSFLFDGEASRKTRVQSGEWARV
jgi:hypothetical protein